LAQGNALQQAQAIQRPTPRAARRLALIALLTALGVSTNYALIFLPNVKLMDAVVFVAGFAMGPGAGALTAALVWLVYGVINPYGFSLPILLTTITGETVYGVVGGLLGRRMSRRGKPGAGLAASERSILLGVTGLLCTLVYDVFTNAVSGLIAYNSIWLGLATMNFPLPLGLMHEASNLFFFALVAPLLISITQRYAAPQGALSWGGGTP